MSAPAAISPPTLHSDEQPVAEYRSVSRPAVVSVVLGIAAALVIISPLLAPVPLAAIVIAVVALWNISRSGGQLVGGRAAIAGLCLAALFLGWGFARHLSRQATLVQHGRQTAEAFLDLVQAGKLKEALQLRKPAASRIASADALAEHYEKNAEAAQELKGFAGNQFVKDLIAAGKQADLRFESVASATREGYGDRLVLKYSYQRPSGGRQPLWVYVNRQATEATKLPTWEVMATDTHPPPGTPAE